MIAFKDIEKSFGKLSVLKGVNIHIQEPGVYAVLGPNGSGKTTLIKSLLGLVIPDAGDILFNGKTVLKQWKYRHHISYLPQIAHFPKNITVFELIRLIKSFQHQPAREDEYIEHFGLESFMAKKLGHLSGGTRQKVNLTLCFMADHPVRVLDEPTSGLDPAAMLVLKEIIKQEKTKGKYILLTSHVMQFVEEVTDELIYLLEGKVHFRGKSEDLLARTHTHTVEAAIANLILRENV